MSDENNKNNDTKNPWETNPECWSSSSAFFSYLRGCLRRAWKTNPIKLNKIKQDRYKIPNPNKRGRAKEVWGFCCEMCKGEFVMAKCQVDHIVPAGKLNKREDIQPFVERLLFVAEDDLRLVCKDCNSALSMADRRGITFEEARTEKRAIEYCKLPVEQLKEIIEPHSLPAKNAKERRESIKKLIEKGEIE